MLRVLGLVLTTALLLGISSCTSPTPTNAPTATGSPTATTTPSPTATSPPTTPSPGAPTTASVKGTNFKWTDDASGNNVTTIKVGGTVTWTAVGNHRLERDASSAANGCDELDASFDSPRIAQPVTRTFTKAGTFGYHCGVHGGTANCKNPTASEGMSAVIKVVP